MKDKQMTLSKTELKIMRFIWKKDGPVTVIEIIDYFRLAYGKEYARQTINTFCKKMVEKGFLIQEDGLSYHRKGYTSRITEEEYARQVLCNYKDLYFGGSTADLIVSLLHTKNITDEERKKIRDHIDAME